MRDRGLARPGDLTRRVGGGKGVKCTHTSFIDKLNRGRQCNYPLNFSIPLKEMQHSVESPNVKFHSLVDR